MNTTNNYIYYVNIIINMGVFSKIVIAYGIIIDANIANILNILSKDGEEELYAKFGTRTMWNKKNYQNYTYFKNNILIDNCEITNNQYHMMDKFGFVYLKHTCISVFDIKGNFSGRGCVINNLQIIQPSEEDIASFKMCIAWATKLLDVKLDENLDYCSNIYCYNY